MNRELTLRNELKELDKNKIKCKELAGIVKETKKLNKYHCYACGGERHLIYGKNVMSDYIRWVKLGEFNRLKEENVQELLVENPYREDKFYCLFCRGKFSIEVNKKMSLYIDVICGRCEFSIELKNKITIIT